VDTFTRSATKANSWEFPLLLKKDLNAAAVKPYGDIGLALCHVGGTSHIVNTVFPSRVFELNATPPELIHDWTSGFVSGGGVELHAGPPGFRLKCGTRGGFVKVSVHRPASFNRT
jgi:hypothetical protein